MPEDISHPLVKTVPGHLLQFEEKLFGMTLTQLLTDLAMAGITVLLTSALPLLPRLIVCVLMLATILVLVHGKVGGYTMLFWLFLLGRSWTLPRRTVWRPQQVPVSRGEPRSVQQTWLPMQTLDHGMMGLRTPTRHRGEAQVTLWVVFQVESAQNVRFLAEAEQVKIYERFKSFLDGLSFPLKCLSLVEQMDPQSDPALVAGREAIRRLEATPRMQQLQRASLRHQQSMLAHCTITRHFVVVAASTAEVARMQTDGSPRSLFTALWTLLSPAKVPVVTPEQVKQELRVRMSVVKKALQHLEVHAQMLDDQPLLRAVASCLAPGLSIPSFAVRVVTPPPTKTPTSPVSPATSTPDTGKRPVWKKLVEGLHTPIAYRSPHPQAQLEPDRTRLADLLAPSSVHLLKDAIEITARGNTRYVRYFEVIGFAPEVIGGWQEELTTLSLPLLVMTRFQPLDSRFMVKKLELHLTKLESQRLADKKALRLTKADQTIEAEQVKQVMEALARKKLKVFAVQMLLGVHASTPERLEERARYLLSHLRDLQLRTRPLARRHDLGWQACLPADLAWPDQYTNLPSDVLSTFMHWSTGVVGTPTGAYLGTTGTGLSQRPVYFNPWDAHTRLPNPHVVICGESGMGKSWLVKTLILGLLCAGIADAVVLDRDGDYDAIHESLHGESQRFNLAGVSPINLLDIPYGPADVSLDDPVDLLATFIEHHLLIGLALLYGEPLSKAQEAFLTHAAREIYAARGITMEAIRRDPATLLREPPVFADLLAALHDVPASSETVRQTLLERFEQVAYLFPGQTTVRFDRPLTIFNIHTLDEKWYPLMIYVVQTCLQRHRTLRRDERYLAYVVEEASYMLKHPAGKRYLESGSRGFRKLGIAQFTLSQHPADFLEDGQVIIGNAGTCFFLGMQRHTAQKLHLAEELERVLEEGVSGRAIMRCGREYAAIDVTKGSALHQAIFTTDPRERRVLRQRQQALVPQERPNVPVPITGEMHQDQGEGPSMATMMNGSLPVEEEAHLGREETSEVSSSMKDEEGRASSRHHRHRRSRHTARVCEALSSPEPTSMQHVAASSPPSPEPYDCV